MYWLFAKSRNKENRRNTDKTPNTHMHDCSLSLFGTSTSVKGDGVKPELFLGSNIHSEKRLNIPKGFVKICKSKKDRQHKDQKNKQRSIKHHTEN